MAMAMALLPATLFAQAVPSDYQSVLTTLARTGDFKDNVLKVNIPRNDLRVTIRTPADAIVAGDVAMLEGELPKVLSTLRANNIDVVAIHHHMTDVKPMVVFLHYFGIGPAETLARAVRAAVDQLGTSRSPAGADARVMFVCEHGAAKSLIAAAYFNKLAAERGLPDRAMFRGSDPQEAISTRAVEGLRADGVAVPDGRPTAIDAADVNSVTYIFAIGCVLPKVAASSGKASDWSDVPDDKGYGPMRDAIVTHVRAVLDDIQRRKR